MITFHRNTHWASGHHKYFCSDRLGLLRQTGARTVNEDRIRRQQVRNSTLKQARGVRHGGNRCGVVARLLKPASASLARGTPPLTRAFQVLNTLFNTLAYQPGHGQQPYLFWGSWLAHNADELARLQDAHGPTLQGVFMGTCQELELLEQGLVFSDPPLSSLIQLLNAPNYATLPGTKNGLCPING